MKQLYTSLLLVVTSIATSQPCVVSTPWASNSITEWIASDMRPDGSTMAVLAINDGLADVLAVQLDPTGQVVWEERLMPTNTRFQLLPKQVIATSNNGMLVFGYINHHPVYPYVGYRNLFAIQLDDQGGILWAKIYMMHGSEDGYFYQGTRVAELPGGGFLMSKGHWRAFNQFEIDSNGMPSPGTGYSAYDFALPTNWNYGYSSDLLLEPNGDRVMVGMSNQVPWLLKTDDQGQAIFANRYNVGYARPTAVTKANNGDYILVGQTDNTTDGQPFAMRVDNTGAFLWMKSYDIPTNAQITAVEELPNGELVMLINTTFIYPHPNFPSIAENLMRTAADGVPIEAWQHDATSSDSILTELIDVRGDSVIIGMTQQFGGGNSAPIILYTQNVSSVGCGLAPATITHSVMPAPTSVTPFLFTRPDSIKVWDMHIGQFDMNSLDMHSTLTSGPARPGFDVNYYGALRNLGGLTSGTLNVTFEFDPLLTFVSATPAGYTVTGNQVTWSGLPAATSLSSLPIQITLNVDPNPANLGVMIPGVFSVTQPDPEVSLTNNTDTLMTMITGAYDPNDKLVSPENVFEPGADDVLNYTIRFQNTGIDTAFNVVVVDTLPAEVSVGTFQPGASSHPYTYTLEASGLLTFTFDNILLPDSFVNEPASHGLVNFSIEPDDGLPLGTQISNSADIYFDFNPPVRTPPAVVSYGTPVGVEVVLADEQIQLYPVPVGDALTAVLPDSFRAHSLLLTTMDGRVVQHTQLQQVTDRFSMDLGQLPAGLYVLTMNGEQGHRLSTRFVKE